MSRANGICRKMLSIFRRLTELDIIASPGKRAIRFGATIRDNRKRVMVFGDSNAYRPGNSRNSWPAMLQHQQGKTLLVINESCDGRTTRYDRGEYNGLGIIEKKINDAKPVDVVLIALGTNDVKNIYGPPNAADVVDGIDHIIQAINRCDGGAKPILLTPPPLGTVICGDLVGAEERIPLLVEEYHRLSSTRSIPLINLYSIIDPNKDLEADQVHLNNRGRKKVAGAVGGHLQGENKHVEPSK